MNKKLDTKKILSQALNSEHSASVKVNRSVDDG
jgi:hypothetical protein